MIRINKNFKTVDTRAYIVKALQLKVEPGTEPFKFRVKNAIANCFPEYVLSCMFDDSVLINSRNPNNPIPEVCLLFSIALCKKLEKTSSPTSGGTFVIRVLIPKETILE